MIIALPYGGDSLEINTDDLPANARFAGRFTCKFPPPLDRHQIEHYLLAELRALKELLSKSKILTIVNDGYRRNPSAAILSIIWPFVKDGRFAVATGTHRRPTDDELKTIFGPLLPAISPRLVIHDCYDKSSLVNIGTTSSGTPVVVNQAVMDADIIVAINSVEPHFFAGYTGGRKSVVPGLAGFETIQANHRFAKDENACPLSLDANPLHLDLQEALSLVGKLMLAVHCVTDRTGEIIDLSLGDLNETFRKACSAAGRYYIVPVPRKFDVVIANCEPPLDANLYQLQKAQEHGARMVADGGVLITMGACHEGVGSEYFIKLAEKYPTPESALREGMADDSFGIHKLIKTARHLRRFDVYYVTTLDEAIMARVYLKAFRSLREALHKALAKLDRSAQIAVLDDAGYAVPVVER